MKKSYFFKNKVKSIICFAVFSMFLFVSSCYAQMYYYYPTGGGTITSSGGNVFNVGTGTQLTVNVPMCITGNTNPKNATNFNLSWYVNTVNSNTGGTFVSGGTQSTGTNFNALYSLAISNSTPGVYYYYAVSNGGNASVCSGTNSMKSSVFQVTVNGPATHLNFDGVDDYVGVAAATNIPIGNSNYTIEAWIKPSSIAARGIVGWGNWGEYNQTNAFRLTNTGLVNYWWSNDLDVTYAFTLNTWYHVACSYDGTTRKIYVDGVVVGQDTPTGHNVPNANNFRIGSTSSGEYFNGGIDEVRIWNVARTPEQIFGSRNCELQGTDTGLVAYYKFNQGFDAGDNAGVTTLNATTGSNGTLTNFALSSATSNWLAGSPVTTGNTCTTLSTVGFNVNSNFKIYPNPTQNEVTIEINNLNEAKLEVFDINGRLLQKQTLNTAQNKVNVNDLPAGMYLFKVTSVEGTATQKVVKQ